ncbi:hypothetical protein D3C78_1618870 [compost metagenome]
MCLPESEGEREQGDQKNEPPLLQHFGKIDDHHGKGRQLCAKGGEYGLELGDHLDQQDCRNNDGDNDHRNWIGHRLLDLGLQRLGLFLVGRYAVEQRFQRTGLLARIHQVAIEIVEIQRLLAQ